MCVTHPVKYSDAFSTPSFRAMLTPNKTAAMTCNKKIFELITPAETKWTTPSIVMNKAYILFEKSSKVKFDQTFDKNYQL
jgi:hypothetical protein